MPRCRWLLPALLLASGLTLAACEDDYGSPCTLPTKVRQACQQGQSSGSLESHINCVMDENLDCSSKICVVYQDSNAFCSAKCTQDTDCPGSSRCLPFLLLPDSDQYCVPQDKLPAEPEQ
ncbi:MAG: hypothetical protein RBU45_01020 [Myxococcota bacterium]|jgi:hypothetical protein|nr:hypothetical protein [Myxococcota bacterium]